MSDTVVHNIKISYDESDERVRRFVGHLKSVGMKEEMRKYHDEALGSSDKKIHLTDDAGNEFTLSCPDMHICNLKTRGM